jgi:SAM-dependent methyltransferase
MGILEDSYVQSNRDTWDAILRLADPAPGGRLLDVGCADGSLTEELARKTGATDLFGVELADQFIEPARGRGIDVAQADITVRWPYDDGVMDVVLSNQVIEHVAKTDFFFEELKRVLKPGGYAIVATNNAASWHNIVALTIGWQPLPQHVSDRHLVGNPIMLEGDDSYSEEGHRHLRIFTQKAIAELAAAHGLREDGRLGAGWYPLRGGAARFAARWDRLHAAYLIQRYRHA